LTQTVIQMMNDVWNLGIEIGFAKPNVSTRPQASDIMEAPGVA